MHLLHPMLRIVLFVILTLATCAIAADYDGVKPPYVEVGDCWSYQAEGYFYQGHFREYEVCIARIDKDRDLIQAVATLDKGDREIDVSYSLDWGAVTDLAGVTLSPAARYMKFPLTIGDRYSLEIAYSDPRNSATVGGTSWNMTVAGWESVTVPAGTFRAIKIDGIGRTSHNRGDNYVSIQIWYVPEVNRSVKSMFRSPTIRRVEELTSYRLNR